MFAGLRRLPIDDRSDTDVYHDRSVFGFHSGWIDVTNSSSRKRSDSEGLRSSLSGSSHQPNATIQPPLPAEEIEALLRSADDGVRLTLEDLGDLDIDITIELGRAELTIEDVLKLREGAVVSLDKLAGDPVDIVANGRLVARGELIVIQGKFGVRLSEVL